MVELPIHAVLPDLVAALDAGPNAVLVAPPGAGKTTAVAPALLDRAWCTGRVLLLSPRWIAAAERIIEPPRRAAPRLRVPFLYGLVRHPLYAGFLLVFWATPQMSLGHLPFAAGMSAYILIAIRYEERDMVAVFGADYVAYRGRVGMLTPRLRRGAR